MTKTTKNTKSKMVKVGSLEGFTSKAGRQCFNGILFKNEVTAFAKTADECVEHPNRPYISVVLDEERDEGAKANYVASLWLKKSSKGLKYFSGIYENGDVIMNIVGFFDKKDNNKIDLFLSGEAAKSDELPF